MGAVLAAAPDLDVVGFRLSVPYGSLFGHRGITHSLVIALLGGGLAAYLLARSRSSASRRWLAAYLILAIMSHGILDTMTTGGLGVALFAPFTSARYFLPWRPIAVSPIGIRPFFTRHGAAILANEALWVGLPSLAIALCGSWYGRRVRAREGAVS